MGELGGQLAGVLGAELGPTEDEWRRRHRPELATSSLAAYRRLLEADEANSQRRFRDAVELAHAALAIDPGYTGAWARLTGYYWNLNLRDSVLFALEQAEEKPHRVGDVAMWGARANGALAEGDLTKHLLLKERIFRDVPLGANEYAVALAVLGRHEEAVDVIEEWCADLPYRPNDTVVDNVIYWLIALGRFDDAGRWADHLSGTFQLDWQFRIALATADWAEAERHRVTLTAIYPPGIRAASLFAARGQVEEAYSILAQRSQRLAVDRPSSVLAGVEAALTLAMASGDPPPWEQALIQSDTTGRARSIAVIWAAVNRDTATARAYLSALPTPQSFETGSVTGNEAHLALAHASLAYAAADWREVVRLLQPVTGTSAWIGAGPGPSTRRLAHWTIAAAYERLGEPDSAVVHWRKLAASEGMRGAQTIIRGFSHSFAHRRAALAYGRLDEPDKAVEHWRVFLADFSDPDPDYLWMVDEAEDELARLGG